MAVPQGKITKLDLRIPNDLYAQIESIAIEEGAKINHISGKPTLSPTVIKLLEEAVEQRNYAPTESEEERLLKAQDLIVKALEKITVKLSVLENRPVRQIVLGKTLLGNRDRKEAVDKIPNGAIQQIVRRSRSSGSDELKTEE